MSNYFFVCVLLVVNYKVRGLNYHSFLGTQLPDEEFKYYKDEGVLSFCTKEIEPCSEYEGRRIDGSCNNIHNPILGMAGLPYERILPPHYGPRNTLRRASDGSKLPLARRIRTTLFPTGVVRSHRFSAAAVHFAGFVALDISTTSSIADVLVQKPYCCTQLGLVDRNCIPIHVPKDDPILRDSSIRCMNMTRAQAFQDYECIPNSKPRQPINFATPLMDLSSIYGTNSTVTSNLRAFWKGQMQMEVRKNRYMPPINTSEEYRKLFCMGNKKDESICYKFAQPGSNFDTRLIIFTTWFLREHNRLAHYLSEINPCWSDETLFKTARQINIATEQNIHYYEWLPLILGTKSLIENKVIYKTIGNVNDYNKNIRPGVLAEYVIALRYFHTLIDGRLKSYNNKGEHLGFLSFSDLLSRPGIVERGNVLEDFTQGIFRQRMAEIDNVFDPDFSERFYSQFQAANDLITTDIQRSRDFGLPPYYKYRELCGLKKAKSFYDFLDVMDRNVVENLRSLYKSFKDVDLLVGVYSERLLGEGVENASVGTTLHCIMVQQNLIYRRADRFFYEHGDQTNSFTKEQIAEIRGTTIARLGCDHGDSITEVQPHGFLLADEGNKPVPCETITGIDLTKWKDDSCSSTPRHLESHSARHDFPGFNEVLVELPDGDE